MMWREMRGFALSVLGRYARSQLFLTTEFARAARWYLKQYEATTGDFERDGEAWLVRRLAEADALRSVIDVGANRGDWSALVYHVAPTARIDSFEIAPATAEELRRRFAAVESVHVNGFGLAERTCAREIQYFPDHSTVTTLICGIEGLHQNDERRVVTAEVRRGDEYCRAHGLERVDLMKIDTEGAEHLVLDGFGQMVTQGRIDVIQFEYGMANIYSRFLLRDHYRLFEDSGYVVGKLSPRGVLFKEYKPWDEDFQGPNYVAVVKRREDLIEALRYGF